MHPVEGRDPAPLEQGGDLLVGEDHQALDQPVGLGLLDPASGDDVACLVELELGLAGGDRQLAGGAGLAEAGRRRPGDPERLRDLLRGRLAAGEDAVEAVVVEARVGADHAAIEAGGADRRAGAELDLGGDGEPLDPRGEAAGLVAQHRGEHRRDRARDVGAVRPLQGLAVERRSPAARAPRRRRYGSTAARRRPRAAPRRRRRSPWRMRGSTVKVESLVRSRRGPGSAATEAAASRASRSSASRKPRPGPRSHSSAAETSRATVAEPSSRSTRPLPGPNSTRAMRPSRSRPSRPSGTCGPRSNSGTAAAKRPRRSTSATWVPRNERPAPLRARSLNPAPAPRPAPAPARRARRARAAGPRRPVWRDGRAPGRRA